MLPVYLKVVSSDNHESLTTNLNKCEGNLYKLREDIDDFLRERYKREFVCMVSEIQQKLFYRGDLEEEIKEFLLNKGF